MQEEDSDPDKKLFAVEQRAAQFEKKMLWLALILFLLLWFFFLQDQLISTYETRIPLSKVQYGL